MVRVLRFTAHTATAYMKILLFLSDLGIGVTLPPPTWGPSSNETLEERKQALKVTIANMTVAEVSNS